MVNVIGLGYIGLPTTLMMASHGVDVVGTSHRQSQVDELRQGKVTFKKKGLDELFQESIKGGVKFTTKYQVADTYVISVRIPYNKFTKKIDAKYVVEALKDVLTVTPKGCTIVIESTVSPGTIDEYVRPVIRAAGINIGTDYLYKEK